jgi:hypothetical protein
MKKRFILPIILAPIMMFLSSCEEDDKVTQDEQVTPVDLIMPINTGNSWTYNRSYGNSDDQNHYTYMIEIGEKIVIDGKTSYTNVANLPYYNTKVLIGNDKMGNYVSYGAISDIDSLFTTSIEYKRDAQLGEEWDYKPISINYGDGTFEQYIIPVKCIAVDTLISTPKGSFVCKGFEESINPGINVFRYYLSLNIGIVKIERYDYGDLFSFDELIDYNLNK